MPGIEYLTEVVIVIRTDHSSSITRHGGRRRRSRQCRAAGRSRIASAPSFTLDCRLGRGLAATADAAGGASACASYNSAWSRHDAGFLSTEGWL